MVRVSKTIPEYLRLLFRTIAVYAAGAWVAVEVVAFAVQHYGLSRFLVDAAVIIAFGGGMMTATLVWFHGEPGSQRIQAAEILILAILAVSIAVGLFVVGTSDPLQDFRRPSAVRLTIETPTPPPDMPDTDWDRRATWGIGPPKSAVFDDRYSYSKFGHASIDIPGVKLWAENYPVLLEFLYSGNIRLTVVFVEFPRDLEAILERGEDQSSAVVESTQGSLFSLHIDRQFRIESEDNLISIFVPGPFFVKVPDD